MFSYKPFTKEERGALLVKVILSAENPCWPDRDFLHYEATVRECEERIAALEAELAAAKGQTCVTCKYSTISTREFANGNKIGAVFCHHWKDTLLMVKPDFGCKAWEPEDDADA